MRLGKRLYSLVMFVVVSVLAGLLAAGLAIPAAGVVAEVGKVGAATLVTLPAELETPPQAERSRLLLADGSLLANFYDENRQYVTLDKISPIMKSAQVAVEDHRFYEHGAMDIQGTLRALVSTARGVTQGASTISQQYVKMVQISAAAARGDQEGARKAQENTVARKVQELRYALAIEEKFTKDEILERYLNIAFYGDGAYGVEAAAVHYFGVHASKLDLAQSAMLAGLVRNPVTTNPVKYPRVALERRNDVLDRLAELKLVTPEEAAAAKATGFDKSKVRGNVHGCANSRYPFICDYARRTLLALPSLGATKAEREDNLYRGGLTIQTQIDPKSQNSAQKAVTRVVDPRDPVDSVVVLLEPKTRLIVAMAQNRYQMGTGPGQTFWNMAVGNYDKMGGTEGYQGGSTFKAFVVAAALQNGFGANVTYRVKSTMDFKGWTFGSCAGTIRQNSDWRVSGGAGTYNLYTGAANSVNGYFVQLESQGSNLCDSTTIARDAGLRLATEKSSALVTKFSHYPSFTLGAAEVSPLSLVNAYATFANRGVYCDPIILKSIKARDGTKIAVPDANCKQVLSEDVADGVNKVMQGPYRFGTLRSVGYLLPAGYQVAGKTGTVSSNAAIWTMGYTPELAGGAMISYSRDPRFKKFWKARGQRYLAGLVLPVSRSYLAGGFGAEVGRQIFRPAFAAALKAYPATKFHEPPADVMNGRKVGIPNCSGVANCTSVLRGAGFVPYVSLVDSDSPKGTFLGLSPSGTAVQGSSIAILVSKGPKPAPSPSPSVTPSKPGKKP